MGALATRTPHRPLPIGLSLARVESVEGRRIVLSGADVVDGTPVLDIKPYLPYADSLPHATVPPWVEASGPSDCLHMASVDLTNQAIAQMEEIWTDVSHRSLYSHPSELQELCCQVLSRDIRSAVQRSKQPGRAHGSLGASTMGGEGCDDECKLVDQQEEPVVAYHVSLDVVDFTYHVSPDNRVIVTEAKACKQS